MIVPQTVTEVTSVPLLDCSRGNLPLKAEIMELISSILDSGQFIGGPFVQALEESVAAASDSRFAIGCASGSDALLLALMALNIQPGDEVICPSFTFFATASAITRVGATPVFGDIDPATFNLDVTQLESLITDRTRAIIPVHLFGQCCDMQALEKLAAAFGLPIIEDCAQSIGAGFQGQRAGGMGAIGCFSFYPTKNIGGYGDGGMLTTNDEDLAKRLRLLANHGMSPRYYHSEVGINSRLDAIQAAVLGVKMKHADQYSRRRRENAEYYQLLFRQTCLSPLISLPKTLEGCDHVWNQFTIRIPDGLRDEVRRRLAEAKVGTEVYYPVPLHLQQCFAKVPVKPGSLPHTEQAAREVLALPIFPELTRPEQEHVVESLATVIRELLW